MHPTGLQILTYNVTLCQVHLISGDLDKATSAVRAAVLSPNSAAYSSCAPLLPQSKHTPEDRSTGGPWRREGHISNWMGLKHVLGPPYIEATVELIALPGCSRSKDPPGA